MFCGRERKLPGGPGHTEVHLRRGDAQHMSSLGGDAKECAHWVI